MHCAWYRMRGPLPWAALSLTPGRFVKALMVLTLGPNRGRAKGTRPSHLPSNGAYALLLLLGVSGLQMPPPAREIP